MFKKSVSFLILAAMVVTLFGIGAATAAPSDRAVTELTIFWAQWEPADYLQEIGNGYEAETGIKVNVVQEPWGSFQDRMSTEWAARATLRTWSLATASGWARARRRVTTWN